MVKTLSEWPTHCGPTHPRGSARKRRDHPTPPDLIGNVVPRTRTHFEDTMSQNLTEQPDLYKLWSIVVRISPNQDFLRFFQSATSCLKSQLIKLIPQISVVSIPRMAHQRQHIGIQLQDLVHQLFPAQLPPERFKIQPAFSSIHVDIKERLTTCHPYPTESFETSQNQLVLSRLLVVLLVMIVPLKQVRFQQLVAQPEEGVLRFHLLDLLW